MAAGRSLDPVAAPHSLMAARIDLGALQRQLDSFQSRFAAWAQRTVSGAESLRDGHLARLREFQSADGGGCL